MVVGFAVQPAHAHAPMMTDQQIRQHLVSKMEPKAYAKFLVHERYERAGKQWRCLARLWGKESAWNHKAANTVSTAFGIPQFLNQTWINYGYPVRPKNPKVQIRAGLKYIKARYQSPCGAWRFWLREAGEDKKGGWY